VIRRLSELRRAPKDDFARRVARRVAGPNATSRAARFATAPEGPLMATAAGAASLVARVRYRRVVSAGDLLVARSGAHALLARRVAAATTRETMQENLDAVTQALGRSGTPYFLTPALTGRNYQVGVNASDRRRALDGLRSAGDPTLYVEWTTPVTERRRLRRVDDLSRRDARSLLQSEMWRVVRARVVGSTISPLLHGCDVHFWTQDGSRLVTTTPNAITAEIPDEEHTPARVHLADGDYRSLDALADQTRVEQVTAPIDVVYTWVDGSDACWRAKKDAALADEMHRRNRRAGDTARYENRDELRYSLRSLWMHADFVRHVYIVTDEQVPDWLDTSCSRVSIVDHREVFGDSGRLPTFNSHAIETRLHHIDGLSEQYLYLNDDVMFGRRVTAETFFHANGLSKFFPSRAQLPLGPSTVHDSPVDAAGKNNRELVRERFGRLVTQKLKHTPHAQRRSVLFEMEDVFPDELKRTSASQFRSHDDLSVAASLYHWYAYLTGRAVPGEISYDYFNLASWDLAPRLRTLLARRHRDVFCLNDTDVEARDLAHQYEAVSRFLREYFPDPSPFERG
jgi:hypothetical protein